VIETEGATLLGGAGATNAARVIVTNAVNASVARASALTNGIFAPHVIGADSTGVGNFLQNDATTGFVAYSGATNTSLLGLAPTAIGNISSSQSLTGTNSIYAFRTTADVSGGTLVISAIDNLRQGGILINGSNTISSNLIFNPASATAAGTGTLAEGLVYVKTGETATISGNVTANAFTKFGKGTLVLSGSNTVTGDVSVQEGTLRLNGGSPFSRMNSELNINAGASLDLNGNSVSVETIGGNNRTIATAPVGGSITNTGAASTLAVASPVASSYTGTLNGSLKVLKAGAGALTIQGFSASAPDSGNNTYTGGTDIYGVGTTGGITLNNTTFGLGGFGTTTQPVVNLYSGTLGLLFSNGTTGVNGTNGQQFSNVAVRFGADDGVGMTLNVRGPAQINVNQATPSNNTAFGQGNLMQVGNLNMSNNTLQLSGGNLYRLKVAGTTTIQGAQATFQTNSDSTAIQLDGLVTGSGAINKTGDGTLRTLIFTNTGNNFSGGLNIQAGDVQNTNPSTNTLGTGAVRVFPEGTLRIAGNGGVNGANLQVFSRVNSLGAVVLDDNFNPTVLTSSNFISVYNTTLQLAQPYFTQALDLSTIGDGRTFLGSGINTEVKYMAATLGAGAVDAWNPGVGVYRLVGGVNNFAFDGVDNVLTGGNYVQVGPQRNNVLGATGNTGNTVIIRNSNNVSGGMQITEGTAVAVEVGGSPVGETPLGSGAVEVYGSLTFQGSLGSNWNAGTSAASTPNINLRPGGTVRLIDGNIYGSGGNLVAGGQGRWGDAVGIDLNGGTFRYDGAANFNSVETIGDVTVRKGGALLVARTTTASSAQLNVGNLDRIDRGTLTVSYGTVGFLGTNLTTPMSYDRLTATQVDGTAIASALAGTTTNGAGVVNGGMLAPWIIDATGNTFLGYNPTGTGTGFQALVSTATPGAGEISYNQILSGATIGALASTDIVDVTTAAKTLGANTSLHALRLNQNISPTATFNTLTVVSGGILNTGTPTINPTGAVTAGVVSPMTINFGTGGAGEAIFYNAGNMIVQAQMVAALGLTKFGGSTLTINSINPGIDGAVTINAGAVVARVPFSGTGTPLGAGNGVFGGQDVILNGGTLQLDPFMANAGGTASEIASNVRATAIFDSHIRVRGDAGLNNNAQANYVRISDLTFENAGGATAMDGNGVITLALQSGVWVNGTTTLIPQAAFNMTSNSGVMATFAGQVTGTADLEKFGNGTMNLINASNNYSGGTTIWGTTAATRASTVASGVRGAGTPFGTGAITVNPGAVVRISDNLNIASNAVTLKSDGIGLASLGIAHNGALPTITTGAAVAGSVRVESTGPFAGVLSLDYGYYSQALNMSTLAGGNWWLGNSTQGEAFYFNNTLGAASNGKYLIGGGGDQSGINFGSVLVSGVRTSLFENVFTGGTANTTRVEVGALTADLFANGPSFVNGNSGFQVMATRNTGLLGDVRVNTNTTLAIGNNFALGNGRLVLNGGALRYDLGQNNYATANITLDNNVLIQGDWSTNSGGELVLNGNVAMHDGTAGATRTWSLTGSGAMAVGLTAGSATNGVISGNAGSNLIKNGAQQVSFRGANTYEGYTQIGQSTIVIAGDVLSGVAGPLGNSDSPIILASGAANVGGGISVGGKYTIGRDIVVSQATGTGFSVIEARTNETAVINGGISIITGANVNLGGLGSNNGTGAGGVLVINGPISGAGAVTFGTGAAAPNANGPVSLAGNSNGYSINTYSGGSTFNNTRVEITGDTLFNGPVTAPTIISGPFGTGAMTWTSGETGNGAAFLAVGGPRTIVNAFNATSSAANATYKFMGNQALTFTRNWDINSDSAAVRNRTFQVNNPYQPTTFSGNLSNSATTGSNFIKTGSGLLILTGTNTQANLLTSDAANYGTGVFIDDGILRVNSDAALGNSTTLAAAGPHIAGPADVQLRGGYLSVSSGFTTARQIVLTSSAGGIDVASGQTLTLSTPTRGAFGIRKVGTGTLALNSNANTLNALTLGGGQQLGNVGFFSHTGGVVSTTATSGTPFVTAAATETVTVNSGAISLVGGAVAQAISVPRFIYGAAGGVMLNKGATTSTLTASEAAATAFQRGAAFNSVSYGTLTIRPSVLANLGTGGEQFLITNAGARPANTALTGGDILTVPSVFVALPGAGQDANFARYDATNGFMQHAVTTVSTLGTTAASNVAAITVADTVGAATNDIIDIAALNLAANATSFDGTQTLRINRGGLIFNGATAPTLAVNTLFGTGTGASLTEAIVYVRDGQTGTSTISGNVTARDFTKTGPGLLELSGATNALNTNALRLPVLSVQDGTFRFASSGAQFSNANRPAGINTTLGSYVLNVNEAGIFDMNGQSTSLGGLAGNGTVTSGSAGAVTLTARNGFGVDTTFSGSIGNGSGTVGLTKTGNGILTLNGVGSYTGGTTVQAGRVTNATGVAAVAGGRLEAQTVLALGTGPITLAGGDLRFNGATLLDGGQTTSESSDGVDGLLYGGPNGYDITVAATSVSQGTALPSNTTSVLRAATQNALVNSLTVNAPQLNVTEGIVLVKGASTFSQSNTVLRTVGRLFLQGQINAAGSTITKIGYGGTAGVGELVVTNTESGLAQNNVGLWKVYGGLLNARSADGASNPLGSAPVVELNGGSTNYGLLLNSDGDGTAAAERITTYANTTIRFGSALPVSSAAFVSSGASRLGTDRVIGNNDDKTIVVGNLEVRGALGSAFSYFINANNTSIWVDGTTNFQRDWTFQADGTATTFNGVISGSGTLNRKSNGANVFFNAVNTYDGGSFFTGGGRNLFGSFEGNQVTLSNTAKLGTGHVYVGSLAFLQINDAGNLRSDQNINVAGNLSWASTFSLAADLTLDQVRLRSYGLGGIQNNPTDYYLSASNPSAAVLALGTVYNQALNQRSLGDGMWFIGSATNMVGANGSYDAATLAPGRGNNYRLGAGGSTLFMGSNGNANVLTNTDATALANLIVGAPMTVQNAAAWSGGTGTLVLLQNQNYTGSTLVNRGSTLDFRGTLTTSGIETYGILNVAGEAGTFRSGGAGSNIPVTLRPGSTLRFDNTSAGVLPTTATQGRWEDSAGITLNDAAVRLQGNAAVEVAETVGVITAANGANRIEIVRGVQGRGTELRANSIARSNFGTVQFNTNSEQLGTDERLIITGTAPTVTNGMVAPWMITNTNFEFLTYNADTGFVKAGFTRNQAAAAPLAATVSAPTDRTIFSGAVVLNAGVDFETYALRLDGNVTLGTGNDTTAQLVIGSGGLLSNGTRAITSGIVAGSIGSPAELILFNNGTTTIGDATAANFSTSGQIVATGITKAGAGNLQFVSNNAAFNGDIRLQQGTVELNYTQTSAANPTSVTIGGNGGNIVFQGAGTVLNLRGGNDTFTGNNLTFAKGLVLGDFVPTVTVSIDRAGGTITDKVMVFPTLTFGASNGDVGQIFRVDGRNGFDLAISGTTTLNGRSAFAIENAYTGSASDMFLDGLVTGTGTLIKGPSDGKNREMTLRNVSSLNTYTDGTVLQGGTLRVFAKAPNVATNATTDLTFGGLGSGTITLMQGTLDLRVDNEIGGAPDTNLERVIFGDTVAPNVILNGSTTINVDRTGLVASGTTKQIVLGNLTMGQQQLTVSGGNAYGIEFGGTTSLLGSPFINNTTEVVLNGAISTDGGGAVIINKTNTGTLWINSANPTLAASTYVNAGLLAFGNRLTGSTTANLGAGDIFVNPGAAIQVRGTGNINTGAGQQVNLVGTAYAPSVFRTTFAATQANLTSMIQSRTATSNEITYLAWEANPAAENYNQSTIGDGRIYFGAIAGDRTYTGAAAGSALTPGLSNLANSVMGGTSTNRVYRLGGGDTNARTTVINLTAAGAGLNDVGGATDVQVGSQALLGPNGNYSVGFVLFQDQNTYTGQTVVARNNTLRFSTAMNAGNTAGPLGGNASALVDIYGGLRIEQGGSMLNAAGTANAYTNVNLRPTSNLIFLDMTATGVNSNRWHDSAAVNLDGAAITADAANNADNNTETVGSVIFDRGSRVYLTNEGTGDAFLTAASVTRATASAGAGTGRGTLVFTPTATATFGAAATAGVAQSQFRSTAAITPSTTSAVSGMLPGYYMESNGNRFVKNGANGVTPVVDGDMVAMPTGAGAGNEVVNITATTSMGSFETSIFALRGGAFTLNSPTGANNDATITLTGSGADVGGVASAGAFVINPNLKFGASGTNEALFYTGSTLTVNGFITAGSITKFGTGGTLVIANDQSDAARGTGNGYQGGWVVNEGALQFGQFGSAGNAHSNNTIVLNGSQAGSAQLNLRAQPADTLLNYTYTSGKIFAVDFATIDWDAGASDRVHSISDIEIQQSGGIGNAAANGTLDAYLRVAIGNNRSILSAGSLTVASNAILNVDATAAAANFTAFASNAAYLSNGISSGLSVASLSGSNRLTKWGDGTLYVRGNSSGFSGPLVIDQGSVFVTNNGSLGTGAVTVNRYGVLEVGVAGFAPTNSSVTYNEGSIERWSIDGARSGAVNLGKATLQVAANQINTSATVTLNGGGVQAYNNGDNHSGAQTAGGVLRILPSTVNFTLTADSFLGDRYFEGANGLDSGKQVNDNRPMEEYASGSILEIKGVISGSAGVTKVGYDTVILSGANTYTGATVVTGGRLQLGVDDALPTTGTVTTTANGVLDLNGQNQTVGTLNNVVATTSAGSTSGFITNSGTTVKTLTVGNGVSTNFAYAGVIQHNVALTKTGTATMTLHNANTYTGNTVITGGTLALGANGSVSDSPWVNVQGAASVLDVARGGAGYTFDGKISGGGLDGVGTTYATVANAAKINGNLTLGDHIAEVQGQGTMAPGASSNLANITTAGDALGHIYTNGNLTINGPLVGTASTAIDRLALQITTATVNASTLGAFDYTSTWLTTNAANYLTSTTGNGSLAGHDYINVGGVLTLNQYGRVAVTNLGAGTYAGGDVFNLLDWTSLTNNGFTVNGTQYDGSGDTAFDLDLPTLSAGLLWDTSLFISHGVVFVVPEPSRAMLLLFGLLGLMMRRRRQTI
jgi:autotransporter-associated beta strand protein